MKRVILSLVCVLFFAGCGKKEEPSIPYREGAVVLKCDGIHCSACAGEVMTVLSKISGVEWARVEVDLKEVAFTGTATKEEVSKALESSGFKVLSSK